MNEGCCKECVNEGKDGEATGCCDMGCSCHSKQEEGSDIDAFVRDVTSVGSMSKSEVRRRLDEILSRVRGEGKAYWEPSEYHKDVWREEGRAKGREECGCAKCKI